MNVPKISSKTSLFLLLLVISTLTIIPYLGLTNFHTKGEPREAIVAVSMLQNDNWILPINNGGDIAYKPPFFHWCIAALSLPVGEDHSVALRAFLRHWRQSLWQSCVFSLPNVAETT